MISHAACTKYPLATFLTLQRILALDGITCVLMGALLAGAADALAGLLGLPASLLLYAGIALFPCALLMFAAALRPRRMADLARLIVALNVAWVLGSLLVATVLFAPTGLGIAFVLVQAAAVAVIAALESRGLRRGQSGELAPRS